MSLVLLCNLRIGLQNSVGWWENGHYSAMFSDVTERGFLFKNIVEVLAI